MQAVTNIAKPPCRLKAQTAICTKPSDNPTVHNNYAGSPRTMIKQGNTRPLTTLRRAFLLTAAQTCLQPVSQQQVHMHTHFDVPQAQRTGLTQPGAVSHASKVQRWFTESRHSRCWPDGLLQAAGAKVEHRYWRMHCKPCAARPWY
jgi:hypothetical protein